MASFLSPQSHLSSSSYLSFNHLTPLPTLNPPTHNFNIPPPQPPSFAAANNSNNVLALSHAGNNSIAQQDQDGAGGESQSVNNNNHAIVVADGGGGGGGGGDWRENLPVGVRFRPTDIELINNYLRPYSANPSFKFNQDHPITEANIYDYDPHQLLGLGHDHGDGKRYFYTTLKKIGPLKTSRVVKSQKGGWKPTQKAKEVMDSDTNTIIGYKRPMAFFTNEPNPKTQWLMQEYFLQTRPPADIVLTVVYYYRRRKRDDEHN